MPAKFRFPLFSSPDAYTSDTRTHMRVHGTLSHDAAMLRHRYVENLTHVHKMGFFSAFFFSPLPMCCTCLDHITMRLKGLLEFHTFESEFHNALQQMCAIGTGRVRRQPFLPETRRADSYSMSYNGRDLGQDFRLNCLSLC